MGGGGGEKGAAEARMQPPAAESMSAPRAPNALEMAAAKLAAQGKFDPTVKTVDGLVCVGDPECEACQ